MCRIFFSLSPSLFVFPCHLVTVTVLNYSFMCVNMTFQFTDIKPQYLTNPHNLTKRLGEDATFDCVVAESLPYSTIHWQKDGKALTGGEVTGPFQIPSTKATSLALSVRNVTFSSAGWYGCVAVNPLLPSLPQYSKKAYLTVLRKYIYFWWWMNT